MAAAAQREERETKSLFFPTICQDGKNILRKVPREGGKGGGGGEGKKSRALRNKSLRGEGREGGKFVQFDLNSLYYISRGHPSPVPPSRSRSPTPAATALAGELKVSNDNLLRYY